MSGYYIQNVGCFGNSVKWWRVDGNGYTVNIEEAWCVTEEKALEITRCRPDEDIAWPAELVRSLVTGQVDVQKLRGKEPLENPRRKKSVCAI